MKFVVKFKKLNKLNYMTLYTQIKNINLEKMKILNYFYLKNELNKSKYENHQSTQILKSFTL